MADYINNDEFTNGSGFGKITKEIRATIGSGLSDLKPNAAGNLYCYIFVKEVVTVTRKDGRVINEEQLGEEKGDLLLMFWKDSFSEENKSKFDEVLPYLKRGQIITAYGTGDIREMPSKQNTMPRLVFNVNNFDIAEAKDGYGNIVF